MSISDFYTVYQREWQKAYVDTLQHAMPAFIIVADSMSFWAVPDFARFLHSLPGFDSLLAHTYVKDTAFGGYNIYRRTASF